ncbi:FAD-dependent oxidoreductase [Patescibacteria group bacterium]|nr:FAD-dependent oxidoreductase [Patescibacteria group bacterium]
MFQDFSCKIQSKKNLTSDIVKLKIVLKNKDILDFRPGQFIMLGLYDKLGNIWQKRAFSICSSPLNKEYIELVIKIGGSFTQKINKLKTGDKVVVFGPFGEFVFEENRMNNVVLLAGGIGATPFMSIIRYCSQKKLNNKLFLIYSNKIKQNIVFYKELKAIIKKNKNFKVVFSLTSKVPFFWQGEKKRIDKQMIKKYCFPFKNKYFFLCGPKRFIKLTIACLLELGISEDYIKTEKWA